MIGSVFVSVVCTVCICVFCLGFVSDSVCVVVFEIVSDSVCVAVFEIVSDSGCVVCLGTVCNSVFGISAVYGCVSRFLFRLLIQTRIEYPKLFCPY